MNTSKYMGNIFGTLFDKVKLGFKPRYHSSDFAPYMGQNLKVGTWSGGGGY